MKVVYSYFDKWHILGENEKVPRGTPTFVGWVKFLELHGIRPHEILVGEMS
jgi:hypothetical protein